ncbi:amidohydrolase [Agrobacterium sp. LAD9]|uniref:amidohydrolase n=1 Tax=Agrobacterium sp. LAD9 TaxID=2055153 RepID=UPI000D1E97E2|nr:amidohydrolase [Agrobacterium sp. LAD9]
MSKQIVILGGRVITVAGSNDDDRWQGVLVQGDRIVRLVTRQEVADLGPEVDVVDLGDQTLMPGFVDVHAHAEVVCRTSYKTVDCRAPECGTIPDVLDALSSYQSSLGAGEWLVGQANLFFDRKLEEKRLPSRAELDSISTERPIVLRAGGHISVLNSKALALAGIDRKFEPPAHSVTGRPEVIRDGSGEPTGVIKEMDSLLPLPSPDAEELRDAIEQGLRKYFTAYGVTTIGEISETIIGIECMNDLAEMGRLPASIRTYLWSPGTLESLDMVKNWKDHITLTASERDIRIQGLKLFSDGGFSAKSAAVNCCYVGHPGFSGSIAFDQYFLRRAFLMTQEAGLQLAVHANGDRAQDWLCKMVIKLGGANAGRTRMRIEHAGNFMPNPGSADLWSQAGIIPVPQPVFIYTFGEYFPDYLGDYGRRGRFPFRTLLDRGWRLSGSSDVWIGSEREATNPFFSIWCCMKRQTYSGNFIDTDEAISFDEALRMHTLDAAATMGEEDEKGSLTPGKVADVIAVNGDPKRMAADEIRSLRPTFVMSRGRTILGMSAAT